MALMLLASTAACSKDTEEVQTTAAQTEAESFSVENLYGTWKGTDGEISTLTLDKSGKYLDDAGDGLYIAGTFIVNEAAMTMTVDETDFGMVIVYHITYTGDTLTLQMDGGLPRKFVKTK